MARPRNFNGKSYSPIDPDIDPAARNRCRRKTNALIKSGKIGRRTDCQHCGRTAVGTGLRGIEVHHTTYRDPYAILWLCHWCHMAEHNRIADEAVFGVGRQNEAWHRRWREEREANRQRRIAYAEAERAKRDARNARIADLYAAGHSPSAIGEAVGLAAPAVGRIIRKVGLIPEAAA